MSSRFRSGGRPKPRRRRSTRAAEIIAQARAEAEQQVREAQAAAQRGLDEQKDLGRAVKHVLRTCGSGLRPPDSATGGVESMLYKLPLQRECLVHLVAEPLVDVERARRRIHIDFERRGVKTVPFRSVECVREEG